MILTEQETICLREKVKTILSVGFHEVLFEKADGSVRRMTCTRDLDLLPYKEIQAPKPEASKEPVSYIRVFDTKLNEWRSFRFDKLVSVNGLQTETLLVM
ncbi:tail fibers protein [Escherichia phage vB_EcoM_FB]|nr:tail fibers protein [Escherichia phage vB_EcoM_FB]